MGLWQQKKLEAQIGYLGLESRLTASLTRVGVCKDLLDECRSESAEVKFSEVRALRHSSQVWGR